MIDNTVDSCEDPNTYLEESLMITGYMIPAREGTNVTLHCPPRFELIGSNRSTCMRNGEWEPDPRTAACQGKIWYEQ